MVLDAPRLRVTTVGTPVVPATRVARKRVAQVGGRDGVRFVPSPRQIQVLKPVAHRDAKAAATVAPAQDIENGSGVLAMAALRRLGVTRAAPNT